MPHGEQVTPVLASNAVKCVPAAQLRVQLPRSLYEVPEPPDTSIAVAPVGSVPGKPGGHTGGVESVLPLDMKLMETSYAELSLKRVP